MAIIRWSPFRELQDLQSRFDRVFGNMPLVRTEDETTLFGDWTPAVDIQETEKEYLIKAELPEMKTEDVKVEVLDGMLTIEGERKQEKEEKGLRCRPKSIRRRCKPSSSRAC